MRELNHPGSSIAECLAASAVERYRTPPSREFREAVAIRLADQLGVQIACGASQVTSRVARYFAALDQRGPATVVVSGDRLPAESAAFINSVAGHGAEFDDTCLPVQTHPGAVLFPAAIAVAEEVGASVGELVAAAGLGVEVMLRVAKALSPECLARGVHTPQVVGPFGVAVAAGLLLGSDAATIAQSLQVAGSSVGGLTEYSHGGGSVKRLHTAIPAAWGIRSAYLARYGITGPPRVFEGRKGLVQAFSDHLRAGEIAAELVAPDLIHQVSLKAYNCCYFIHAAIEALTTLVESGVRSTDIISVRVGSSRQAVHHVGAIHSPTDALGAQFSTAYVLAMLLRGDSLDIAAFADEFVPDPETVALARCVEVYEDPTATREYPANWGSVIQVTTRDGATHERRVRYPKGTPENPLSPGEVWRKFGANAEPVIGVARAKRLWEHIIEPVRNVDVREMMAFTVA